MLTNDLMHLQSGWIKRLVDDRGFGFIRTAAGRDLFFHFQDCRGGLGAFTTFTEGQAVSFIETISEKGPRAADVQLG